MEPGTSPDGEWPGACGNETNILTHPSKPRNPCLFQAARKLGIAEDTGRGVDRIYRALLRRLQQRGLLVKTSAQQRGPGVEYGPGPDFPTR